MADQTISEEQKQALVRIYLSFRREHEDEHGAHRPPPAPAAPAGASRRSAAAGRGGAVRSGGPGRLRLSADPPALAGGAFPAAGRL